MPNPIHSNQNEFLYFQNAVFQNNVLSQNYLLEDGPAHILSQDVVGKKNIQETETVSNSWLTNTHPIEHSGASCGFSFMATLTSDGFVGGLPLEENATFIESLEYIVQSTQAQLDILPALKPYHDEMRDLLEVVKSMDRLRKDLMVCGHDADVRDQLITDYSQKLASQLQSNHGGWLPLGWIDPSGDSHLMLGRICHDRWTIVDCGAGLRKHKKYWKMDEKLLDRSSSNPKLTLEEKYQYFKEYRNVPKNKLYAASFIESLVRMNVQHVWDGSFNVQEDFYYSSIPAYFGCQADPDLDPKQHPEAYVKPSRDANCTKKAPLKALQYMCGNKLYKQQKILLQSQSLVSVVRNLIEDDQPIPKATYEMLMESVNNLRDARLKLLNSGVKEDIWEISLLSTLDDIELRLKSLVEDRQETSLLAPMQEVVIQEDNTTVRIIQSKIPTSTSVNSISKIHCGYIDQYIAEWKAIDSEQILNVLPSLAAKLSDLNSNLHIELNVLPQNKKLEILESIKDILQTQLIAMPLDSINNAIQLDPILALESLQATLQAYLLLSSMINQTKGIAKHSATDILVTYSLMAAAKKCIEKAYPHLIENDQQLCVQQFWTEVNSAAFLIHDPNAYKRLEELLYYFSDSATRSAFDYPSNAWSQHIRNSLMDREDAGWSSPQDRIKKESHALFNLSEPVSNGLAWWHKKLNIDDLKSDPTFKLYESLLGDNSIQLLLSQKGIDPSIADSWKALFLMGQTEDKPKILRGVHALQQMAWQTQLFSQPIFGSFIPSTMSNDPLICLDIHQQNSSILDLSLTAHVGKYKLPVTTMGYVESETLQPAVVEDAFGQDYDFEKEFAQQLEQNDVLYSSQAIGTLSTEDVQTMRMINCDPFDSVNRALSFGIKRIDLLKHASFRSFIRAHLFKVGRLESQLYDTPQFSQVLQDFFIHSTQHYQSLGDIETVQELCKLSLEIERYLIKGGHCFSGSFPKMPASYAVFANSAGSFTISPSVNGSAVKTTSYEISIPHAILDRIPAYSGDQVVCTMHPGASPFLEVKDLTGVLPALKITLKSSAPVSTAITSQDLDKLEANRDKLWNYYNRTNRDLDYTFWKEAADRYDAAYNEYISAQDVRDKYTVVRIARTDNKEMGSIEAIPALWKVLEPFIHNPKQIACWRNPITGLIDEVDYLNIRIEDEKVYFRDYPDYTLAQDQSIPSDFRDLNCLVIDNGVQRKILLPKTSLQSNTSLDSRGLLDISLQQTDASQKEWVAFDDVEGEIIANTIEEQCYLAYLFAARREYSSALQMLNEIKPLQRFNAKESEILEWLQAMLQEQKRNGCHSKALLLEMKLLLLLRHNHLKNLTVNNSNITFTNSEEVHSLYRDYLHRQGNLRDQLLNTREEISFLQLLKECLEDEKNLQKGSQLYAADFERYAVLSDFKPRWDYLNGRNVKASVYEPLDMDKINILNNKAQLALIEEDVHVALQVHIAKKGHQVGQAIFVSNDDYFKEHFFDFYKVMTEGTLEEKKRVKDILLLNAHLEKEGAPWRARLLALFPHAHTLPSLATLQAASIKYETTLRAYQDDDSQLNKQNLKNVKKAYFRNLRYIAQGANSWLSPLKDCGKTLKSIFILCKHWFKAQRFKFDAKQDQNIPIKPITLSPTYDIQFLQKKKTDLDSYLKGLATDYFNHTDKDAVFSKQKFSESHPNPLVVRYMQEENKDLEHYRNTHAKCTIYSLKNDKLGHELKDKLKNTLSAWQQNIKVHSEALLWQVNQRFAADGRKKALSWDDLKELFARQDLKKFKAETSLTDSQITLCMQAWADIRMEMLYYKVLLGAKEQISEILNKTHSSLERVELENELGKYLSQDNPVPVAFDDLHILQFASIQGSFQRPDQQKLIQSIRAVKQKQIIAQAPTGIGKTTWITSEKNIEKARSGAFVINTQPESHDLIQAQQLQQQLWHAFQRDIDRLHLDSSTKLTARSLALIYEDLKQDFLDEKPLSITRSTQSYLELYLLHLLEAAHKGNTNTENVEMIRSLILIYRLIRTKGWNRVDEIGKVGSVLETHILGIDNPNSISPKLVDKIEEIVNVLNEEPLCSILKWKSNERKEIDPDIFEKIVVPKLQEKLGKRMDSWLVNVVLKNVLEGMPNRNYGLSKQQPDIIREAIPYDFANKASENAITASKFLVEEKTLLATYSTYYFQGLSNQDIRDAIHHMQHTAKEQCKLGIKLHRTDAFKLFNKIAPGQKDQLMNLDEKEIASLNIDIRNSDLVNYFVKHIVAPTIKVSEEVFVSTAANFLSMSDSYLGLSATPPPADSLPVNTFIPMADSEGRVTEILLTKCADKRTLHIIEDGSKADIVDQTAIIMQNNSKMQLLVDGAGRLAGQKSNDVAGKLHGNGERVIFFDEDKGCFKVKNTQDGSILDVTADFLHSKDKKAYLDEARSIATDMTFAFDAMALILIGKMDKAQLEQNVGRLRKLEQLQKPEFAIYRSLLERIFHDVENRNIMGLLVYMLENKTEIQSLLVHIGQKQLLEDTVRRPMIDLIAGADSTTVGGDTNVRFEEGVDVWQAIKRYSKFGFLKTKNKKDAYVPVTVEQDLKSELHRCQAALHKTKGMPKSVKKRLVAKMQQISSKWNDPSFKDLLNQSIPHMQNLNANVQTTASQNMHMNVHATTTYATKREYQKATRWAKNIDLFKTNWERPIRKQTVSQKVSRKITLKFESLLSKIEKRDLWLQHLSTKHTWSKYIFTPLRAATKGSYLLTKACLFGAQLASSQLHKHQVGPVPIFTVKDILQDEGVETESLNLFSEGCLTTNNASHVVPSSLGGRSNKPFDEDKPLYQVVIVQKKWRDRKTNQIKTNLKVVVPSQDDTKDIRKNLQNDKIKTSKREAAKRHKKICVYDMQRGIIVSEGANAFQPGELEQNPQFHEKLGEVALRYGLLNPDPNTLEGVKIKVQKVGKKVIHRFLQKHVFKKDSDKFRMYKNSPLGKMI